MIYLCHLMGGYPQSEKHSSASYAQFRSCLLCPENKNTLATTTLSIAIKLDHSMYIGLCVFSNRRRVQK